MKAIAFHCYKAETIYLLYIVLSIYLELSIYVELYILNI